MIVEEGDMYIQLLHSRRPAPVSAEIDFLKFKLHRLIPK